MQLVSGDYNGCVNIWDAYSGDKLATHNEHSKRVWSVVFNPIEPTLLASGSDDCTGEWLIILIIAHLFDSSVPPTAVKLWTSNRVQSVHTLKAPANVCAVRFHPKLRYFLAYGSAGTLHNNYNSLLMQNVTFLCLFVLQITLFTVWIYDNNNRSMNSRVITGLSLMSSLSVIMR